MKKSIYTILDNITDTYVGVDALTVTAANDRGQMVISGVIEYLKAQLEVYEVKPFRYRDATGFSQGPVSAGFKRDRYGKKLWSILMIKGEMADEVLPMLYVGGKASRVDLRADVELREPVRDLAERYYKIGRRMGLDCKFFGSVIGDTYYPDARRDKTYYCRIYDKSLEYGKQLGSVWRYEIEVKQTAASQIAQEILDCDDKAVYITDTVFGIANTRWGIPTPKPGIVPKINRIALHAITTESRIDWLRDTVRPAVDKLRKLGYEELVIDALGLNAKTSSQLNEIIDDTRAKEEREQLCMQLLDTNSML